LKNLLAQLDWVQLVADQALQTLIRVITPSQRSSRFHLLGNNKETHFIVGADRHKPSKQASWCVAVMQMHSTVAQRPSTLPINQPLEVSDTQYTSLSPAHPPHATADLQLFSHQSPVCALVPKTPQSDMTAAI